MLNTSTEGGREISLGLIATVARSLTPSGSFTRIDGGDDQPSTLTQLTSASSKMQFMATSSSTSLNSVGTSLETMARKS